MRITFYFLLLQLVTQSLFAEVPQIKIKNINVSDTDTLKLVQETSIADSTVNIDSSAVTRPAPDTLKPVFKKPLISQELYSETLNKEDIRYSDYRYTGDLINSLSFGYLNDLGSMGYLNEAVLYGLGSGYISYLSDDISVNNRLSNSFNLWLYPSESIDSLSLLPLSRGFLLNASNNPAVVSFSSKDRIDLVPYTRIRYYQAAKEEGFIDATFSAYITSRLNATLEISNMSRNNSYVNSEYGNWTGALKLRYMPSNGINILANYRYNKVNTPLNGGVDYESVIAEYTGGDINETIYNERSAPVNYQDRYLKQSYNSLSIQVLGKFLNNLPSTLSMYYNSNLDEYRQNEYRNYPSVDSVKNNHLAETYGILYSQSLNTRYADIDIFGNYEYNKYLTPLLSSITSNSTLSAAGIASLKFLDNKITPNVFAKYLIYDEVSYFGFGTDLSLRLNKELYIYGGIAVFAKPYSLYLREYIDSEEKSSKFYIAEAGIKYRLEDLQLSFLLININEENKPRAIGNNPDESLKTNTVTGFFTEDVTRFALSGNINWKIWNILVEGNISYYPLENSKISSVPEFTLTGGLFYKDILFKDNLNLKAGIKYYIYGGTTHYSYDFERSLSYRHFMNSSGDAEVINDSVYDPTFRLDLFLAGAIRESATIYFVYENLLGSNYFLAPYYPMPSSSIRFGVAWEMFN